uniref:Uncharacterized protein n=1 Tax=Zea mays TaxID=4577 RepID=A0A804Q7X2_MAIZE|eukprot:XP_008653759.1 uncharacterized protein LOC103633870 [Zea mays]
MAVGPLQLPKRPLSPMAGQQLCSPPPMAPPPPCVPSALLPPLAELLRKAAAAAYLDGAQKFQQSSPHFFPWPKVPPAASSAPMASSPGSELLPCIVVGRRCRCHYLAHSSRSELHRRPAQQAARRSSMLLRLAR